MAEAREEKTETDESTANWHKNPWAEAIKRPTDEWRGKGIDNGVDRGDAGRGAIGPLEFLNQRQIEDTEGSYHAS